MRISPLHPVDGIRREGGLRTQGIRKEAAGGLPLVSIITVLYNGDKYLAQTIRSVLDQAYPALEYIIVDGGSTDGSLDIIRQYEDRIDYWVSESDNGISDAFNKGIGLAGGEWIGLINADDWYEKDAVQLAMHQAGAADVVYGNLQCWENGQPEYLFTANHQLLPLEMALNHPTVFVRKRLYQQWGAFNGAYRVAMDYELLLRFYTWGARFSYVNQCLAHMRLEGVSDRKWVEGYQEVKRAKDQHLGRKPVHALYFLKQTVFTFLSRKVGAAAKKSSLLSRLYSFYRDHFSMVQKSKNAGQ
jgi:glycosyltransferase involved in cell wall biosynthesis